MEKRKAFVKLSLKTIIIAIVSLLLILVLFTSIAKAGNVIISIASSAVGFAQCIRGEGGLRIWACIEATWAAIMGAL
ncbi:MAG: hypothetical protein DRN66_00905 [Candidatus Nanohalarchaeota archaeon]|nr:MAG: hypothetical protein DRN66_00905 [Candidatus Nanohaloarchaeota archaeon]